MKLFSRFRGPRLGTKLALLGMALLIVPTLSYRQLVEMERLLIQGQSQAQLLTAEGISTLFNGREDLFNDLPIDIEDFEPLFAHPLANNIRMDGLADDWDEGLLDERLSFGSAEGNRDGDFQLILGERGGQLYAHLRIVDADQVLRDPQKRQIYDQYGHQVCHGRILALLRHRRGGQPYSGQHGLFGRGG